MLYDYTNLRKLIRSKFYKIDTFAKELGLSRHAVSCKLNNHNDWKQSEIEQSIKLFELERKDIINYFFVPKK